MIIYQLVEHIFLHQKQFMTNASAFPDRQDMAGTAMSGGKILLLLWICIHFSKTHSKSYPKS